MGTCGVLGSPIVVSSYQPPGDQLLALIPGVVGESATDDKPPHRSPNQCIESVAVVVVSSSSSTILPLVHTVSYIRP
jgi:hypothetical protein